MASLRATSGRSWARFLSVGALVLVIVGCGRKQVEIPPPPPPRVNVAPVTVRDVPYYLDEIGRCASLESVEVVAQVSGRVEAAHFVEGALVEKGELLFTIDPRPFQAALAQSEASLNQSRENLKLAELEFARVEALKDTSAVSQTEYDQKRSAVAVAQAQVQAAQANVDTARLNLEYCSIKSPITGRTGMRLIHPGNVVRANESALVTIQSLDPIHADFTIPEDRLSEVRQNMAAGSLQALVSLPAGPGRAGATTQPAPRAGQLSMIDNRVQNNTGTIRLRATLPNSDGYFWPGQFVNIRLVLFQKKDAILVPSQAVQIGQQGTYVYVIKHDPGTNMNAAELRPIVTGQKQDELVVVESGLNPGEAVVVTGQMMVMPGGPVTVASDTPAPTTAQVAGVKL